MAASHSILSFTIPSNPLFRPVMDHKQSIQVFSRMAAQAELFELTVRQVSEGTGHPDGGFVEKVWGSSWPNPDPWLPAVGSLCNTIGMMQGQLPIFTRVPDSQYVDVAFLKFVAHLVVTH